MSRLDVGPSRSLTELRLQTSDPGPWAEEVRALPHVEEVEELEKGPSGIHIRVVHRTSEFVPIFRELHLMRRFPFTIQRGEASWVVVAPEAKMRELLRLLKERAPAAAIESVRHSDAPGASGPLTARQADLLSRAIAAGYFEVPRKVTLTDLAKHLGMAPSSLSEGLAIVEKKLLKDWPAPAGAGMPGPEPRDVPW